MECECRVREMDCYRAYYCGLCRCVRRRHGVVAPLMLSYDCTFLALLLDSVYGEAPSSRRVRCLHHCGQRGKHAMQASDALCYAADVQTLLSYYQCLDDWRDDRNPAKGAAALLLKPGIRRLHGQYPTLSLAIKERLDELCALERERCSDSDRVADVFARLMEAIVTLSPMPHDQNTRPLAWMFYNLGRWIYLADACDDLPKDRKKGRYNPFLMRQYDADELEFVLNKSLDEAAKAFDLVTVKRNADLLYNILHLGCPLRTEHILKGANA